MQTGQWPDRAGSRESVRPLGLLLIGYWDNGIRHITNSRRPITVPHDLRGVRIRTPADPAAIDTFQALGAATQQIAFSELHVALQQGVVDGQENALANIHSSKLYEVNRCISFSAHKWECSSVLVSRIACARISDGDWRLLTDAMKEAEAMSRRLMKESDTTLLAEFRANPKVAVNVLLRALPRVGRWPAGLTVLLLFSYVPALTIRL